MRSFWKYKLDRHFFLTSKQRELNHLDNRHQAIFTNRKHIIAYRYYYEKLRFSIQPGLFQTVSSRVLENCNNYSYHNQLLKNSSALNRRNVRNERQLFISQQKSFNFKNHVSLVGNKSSSFLLVSIKQKAFSAFNRRFQHCGFYCKSTTCTAPVLVCSY